MVVNVYLLLCLFLFACPAFEEPLMILLPVLDASLRIPESPLLSTPTTLGFTHPLQLGRICGSLAYRKPPFSASCTLTPMGRDGNSTVFTIDYVEAQCSL
jgi:hypothetical protein